MLSIISDIHLSDASTSFNVSGDAFRNIFNLNVLNAAIPDEKKPGKLPKANEVKIILLGDILDFVRTDYWLAEVKPEERPWNGKIDPKTGMNNNTALMKKHYGIVLDRILEQQSAKDFIDTLKSIKKAIGENRKGVPFTVYYVVGNHDRILNNFTELQEKIKACLEFSDDEIKFVNRFEDLEEYSTICLHGNEFDEHNYGDKLYCALNKDDSVESDKFDEKYYKVQSIGEAVTCELMSGLIYRLKKDNVQDKFLDVVKEVNNVRPMLNVFSWLSWFGKEGVGSDEDRGKLLKAFRDSLKDLVETSLADEWDKVKIDFLLHGDLIYYLKWVLSVIEDIDFDKASSYVKVFRFFAGVKSRIKKMFNPVDEDEYYKAASGIFEKKPEARYVLMGHTHEALNVYFNGDIEGKADMYINTGTFLPFISRWGGAVNPFFVSSNQMTMVNIFKKKEDLIADKDENPYPTVVLWNGIKRKKYH